MQLKSGCVKDLPSSSHSTRDTVWNFKVKPCSVFFFFFFFFSSPKNYILCRGLEQQPARQIRHSRLQGIMFVARLPFFRPARACPAPWRDGRVSRGEFFFVNLCCLCQSFLGTWSVAVYVQILGCTLCADHHHSAPHSFHKASDLGLFLLFGFYFDF